MLLPENQGSAGLSDWNRNRVIGPPNPVLVPWIADPTVIVFSSRPMEPRFQARVNISEAISTSTRVPSSMRFSVSVSPAMRNAASSPAVAPVSASAKASPSSPAVSRAPLMYQSMAWPNSSTSTRVTASREAPPAQSALR